MIMLIMVLLSSFVKRNMKRIKIEDEKIVTDFFVGDVPTLSKHKIGGSNTHWLFIERTINQNKVYQETYACKCKEGNQKNLTSDVLYFATISVVCCAASRKP